MRYCSAHDGLYGLDLRHDGCCDNQYKIHPEREHVNHLYEQTIKGSIQNAMSSSSSVTVIHGTLRRYVHRA